jgi:putative endonuclease
VQPGVPIPNRPPVDANVERLHHPQHRIPDQEYVGATEDLKRRIPEHNAVKSSHSSKFRPQQFVWYCAFPDKHNALAFERHLKSHSGRAFAKKRVC